MNNTNKEYYIKLQAKIDDSAKSVSEINNQVKVLQNKVDSLELKLKMPTTTTRGFSDLNTQLDKLKVRMGDFKDNVLSTNTTLDTTTTRYTNNAGKILTIQEKMIAGEKKYKVALKEVGSAVETNAKQADKWNYSWSKAFQSFTTYMSVTTVFYQTVGAIRNMIQEVTDLDSALTELKKVTDLNNESLQDFITKSYASAETVAKTGTEMIQASTEFAKAGYGEEQILNLGKVALMYTNIADEEVSAAESAEFIIAQLKAFNIEADNAIHIIDAVNEVANNFAVSSADIANNLGKSSSVMAAAGNSYEEMIGLLTAGTEITRSASRVSNGLKTITLRLQGMNEEGEKDLELVAQMETLYNKLGISVYDSNGELKNTFELLKTLAPIYQKATAAEKAYITETIAGKYQAQNAAAILNNFSVAIEASETAMNSSGSAARENAIAIESIKGKVKQLMSQFEELSAKLMSSDFLKYILDIGIAILKVANSDVGQLIFKFGALAISSVAILRVFEKLKLAFVNISAAIKSYTVLQNGLVAQNLRVVASNQALAKSFTLVKTNMAVSATGFSGIEKASKTSALAIGSLTTTVSGLGKALISSPLFWFTLIASGLSFAVEKINEFNKRTETAFQNAKENYDSTVSELDDVNSRLEEISNRIEAIKSQGSLSFTDKSELENLKEETRQLLLQQEILEEREKKERKKLEDAAKNKIEDKLNDTTTYTRTDEKVKDISFLENFGKQFLNPTDKNSLFSASNIQYLDNYIDTLERLKTQYANNKIALQMINEELNRVKTNTQATETVQVSTTSSVKDAINNSMKTYEEYGKKIDDNKKKIEDYKKVVKDYENNNPDVVIGKNKGRKPSLPTFEDKESYMQYQLAKQAIIDITNENKKYSDSQKETKKTLKEQAKVYEDLLSDSEIQSSLSVEQLNVLKDKLIEIYNIIDPNKAKGLLFEEILTSGDYEEPVRALLGFKDAGEVTEEQVDALREKFPEFNKALGEISSEEAAEQMNSLSDKTQNLAEIMNGETQSIQDRLSAIASSFDILNAAVSEYNESGYITASTLKSLMDNNLVQYLQFTTDGVIMNADALYQMEAAAKDAQLATWQLAAAEDIHKLALGDTENVSNIAKTALENLKTKTEQAGYAALNAAGKLALFNNELKREKEIEKGNLNPDVVDPVEFEKQADAVIAAYQKYATALVYTSSKAKKASVSSRGSSSKSPSGGSSSSKSSSSKSEKEWWETELEKLQNQFKYNEITIEKYIDGLSGLLGKLQKGTDAWRKVNEELQKQRLTKVEDDYKRGTISLDEYISKLKELIKAYKQGTDAWNELADKIKEGLQDKLDQQKDDLETAEDAAIGLIDEEIEKLEELRDAEEERYDKLIEEKEKANEETEKEIELARLQEALANAQKEKTKRVWREGIGWVNFCPAL